MEDYQNIPSEYKPISAWGYVGYNLLFSIPLVGFIFLIIYAFDNANLNRRNYARSYFCVMLIAVIMMVIMFIGTFLFTLILGGATASSGSSYLYYY